MTNQPKNQTENLFGWGKFGEGFVFLTEKLKEIVAALPKKLITDTVNKLQFEQSIEQVFYYEKYLFNFCKINGEYFCVSCIIKADEVSKWENYIKNIKEIKHDFNNVMNNSLTALTLLEIKCKNEEPKLTLIESVTHNLHRGINLINEIKTDEESNIKLIDSINIDRLIRNLIKEIEPAFPPNIKINYVNQFTKQNVFANYDSLFRVIINLIVNAKEAIKDIGEINIEVEIKDNLFLLLKIRDNGEGIKAEHLNQIFDYGFSTKTKKTESGIGLGFVKRILNEIDAKINYISTYGEGTEVIIIFPLVKPNISSTNLSSAKGRILIADDEEYMLDLLKELLVGSGYEVDTVADGEELINVCKSKNNYHLLIIDETMPRTGGIEAIKILRKSNITSKIIISSGAIVEDKEKIFNQLKIDAFLKKPYNFDDLLILINRLI